VSTAAQARGLRHRGRARIQLRLLGWRSSADAIDHLRSLPAPPAMPRASRESTLLAAPAKGPG